jgi:hypothetical protein
MQQMQRRPLLLPAVVLALEPSPQRVVAESAAPAQTNFHKIIHTSSKN